MSTYIRFNCLTERTPPQIDGIEFEYAFEIGRIVNGTFVPERAYVLDIQASGTLQAVWHVSNEMMGRIAAALARPYVLQLAREDRLNDLVPFKLNTYTAPKTPPAEVPPLEAGPVEPVAPARTQPRLASLSFLSEDISELRDQINALSKNVWGARVLLLSQERPLFDMYKSASSPQRTFGLEFSPWVSLSRIWTEKSWAR
jgi:hypothetical protein